VPPRLTCLEDVVRVFCAPGLASAWRSEQRPHSVLHAGFLGYPWSDTGYDAMAVLRPAGFEDMPEVGDWPYTFAMRHDAGLAIAHYCEGDFAVEVFCDREHYEEALRHEAAVNPHGGPPVRGISLGEGGS